MRKFIIILISIAIGLTSCEELANQTLPNDVVFFDLKKFMSQEITRLNKLKPKVNKTTRVNNNTETKDLKIENFESELKIFMEADINKLAWIDKYDVDTTYTNNQLSSLDYNANKKKLTTRHLRVEYKNGKVSKIEVLTQASSIVTDVEKQLIYEPDLRYSILSKQKTTGIAGNEIEIIGKF